MRNDLLTLTLDDLAALANRGLVKRAQQEAQAGQITVELHEDAAGELIARWSDDITCTLPAGQSLSGGHCSCNAVNLCRHLLRTVLAYQQQQTSAAQTVAPQVWNPAGITDEMLAQYFRPAALNKLRRQFEAEQVIEATLSVKPSAYFHTLACHLRFLVPHDLRYTHCDCDATPPCSHVPLAVWAFRQLDKPSGIIVTSPPTPVAAALLDDAKRLPHNLLAEGWAHAPQSHFDQWRRLETALRQAGLVWLADIAGEIVRQHEAYAAHDARFDILETVALLGEWEARWRAVRNPTEAVPQLFVRGTSAADVTVTGATRLIGVGCGARRLRHGVELTAYLNDADTGTCYAVAKVFADEPDTEPLTFSQLAQRHALKSVSFAAAGHSQLLIKGGKRAPNRQFIASRANIAVNPQSYAWEKLREPLLINDFGELQARLQTAPPAVLRPRSLTEDFHVFSVSAIVSSNFDNAAQALRVAVADATGQTAQIVHPFVSRAQAGFDALAHYLAQPDAQLLFVAGRGRLAQAGLIVEPVGFVFQDGGTRRLVQPWADSPPERNDRPDDRPPEAHRRPPETVKAADVLADFVSRVTTELGETWLTGLLQADVRQQRRWRELAEYGAGLGLARCVAPLGQLADELARQASTLRWDADIARQLVSEILLFSVLAQAKDAAVAN